MTWQGVLSILLLMTNAQTTTHMDRLLAEENALDQIMVYGEDPANDEAFENAIQNAQDRGLVEGETGFWTAVWNEAREDITL